MEEVNQIGQIILNYGVTVIIMVFIWDYIVNKKKISENQETIKIHYNSGQHNNNYF